MESRCHEESGKEVMNSFWTAMITILITERISLITVGTTKQILVSKFGKAG